jgi:hypothetical protein
MIEKIRKEFNATFKQAFFDACKNNIENAYPGALDFKIAESPVFINKKLGDQMNNTAKFVIDFIKSPDFIALTNSAIPEKEKVENENDHPHFIAIDFGICKNKEGELYPALIEMQGFPTLFGFQAFYPEILEKHFSIPNGFFHYFNGINKETYLEELNNVIVGNSDPKEVIILEIKPHAQKTRIDFYCTETYLGIKTICLTEIIKEEKNLFYIRNGLKTQIKRIYNRIIFDELNAMKDELGPIPDLTSDLDVEWIGHPNWFYRISKFTMPFLRHPFIPETFFLNEISQIPQDLENYVLKPLLSFAGQGVIIDLKESDFQRIENPSNWILQKKVDYAECIETPDIPAKTEIRLMFTWKDGDTEPKLLTNLARLSKGKMIGTRYNKDKTWVGGSVAYFNL